METFVSQLKRDFPEFLFNPGPAASWNPREKIIIFPSSDKQRDIWTLLHELGHGLLDHRNYLSDIDLLRKEVDAWAKAAELAKKYNLSIADDHIQDCLDSYRHWLHRRSTCPTCNHHGVQASERLYTCLNCQAEWKVSLERFCRPYRLKKTLK